MNKEEIIIDGGLLTHYTNENEYYEYDSLYYETLNYLDRLQHENKQLKERIDKAIKYIVKETKSMPINGCKIRLTELQNILKEKGE